MQCVRQFFASKGISGRASEIMLSSWRSSSAKQYGCFIRKWLHFCAGRQIDPLLFNELEVINFLTMLFDEGKSFSAINTARSALSAFMWDNNSGQTIGNLCSVKRLLKGMYELRPPKPRYSCIWDANIVLSYLSNFYPNEDIPLSLLSYKLVMLIALASAQRAQTIHKIYVDRIDFSDDLVIIPICNLIKQSKPGRKMISLRLKPYENPSICVLKVLKEYINELDC